MNIVLVMVSSVNGKITQGNDPNVYSWTSPEDQELFFLLRDKSNLIVMGRKTYEAAKSKMKIMSNKLRVVMTRNPELFHDQSVPGQLEFTNKTPEALIRYLEAKKYKQMLLTGGGQINMLFLKSKLVDELHLTIEPYLFGKGNTLLSDFEGSASLTLMDIKQLNKNGTVHIKYKVRYT